MRHEYTPNPVIIAKACDLWCQMLRQPKFDALGPQSDLRDDPNGSMGLAQMMATSVAAKTGVSEDSLCAFGGRLTTLLRNKTTYDRETGEFVVREDGWYQTSLGVDYGPDAVLAEAGKSAGIPEGRWPWKTHMWISSDYVSLSYGYGAETVYYYPLDDRWLVTRLYGSDISKVLEYVRGGKPEFRIED